MLYEGRTPPDDDGDDSYDPWRYRNVYIIIIIIISN